ncbi:acyltransferase [Arthrobacter sp. 2MCAF14]|uniref:acyltransferase n=1 Tax=Arthrobacter sp. 2MCAF14 TaxID=3232982 RepID=UPI003F8F9D64
MCCVLSTSHKSGFPLLVNSLLQLEVIVKLIPRIWQRIESTVLIYFLRRTYPAIDSSVVFIGRPFVQLLGIGSSLSIGPGSSVVSISSRTALALNHRSNFRAITSGAQIVIGAGVGISGGTFVAARRIQIGDGTLVGANVTICDTDFHPVASLRRNREPLPEAQPGDEIVIGSNVFIGTGATILKGTRVGDNSVVGAGAVVKGRFPNGVTLAGNPAKIIRQIDFQ